MKLAVQINTSPYQNQGADTAFRFIQAALAKGHSVDRVFFYFDGIYNAFGQSSPPDDENHPVTRWSKLAKEKAIDLVVCVSAAQRRGLLDQEEAHRRGVESGLAEGFRISGIGQWVESAIKADRLIVFGG